MYTGGRPRLIRHVPAPQPLDTARARCTCLIAAAVAVRTQPAARPRSPSDAAGLDDDGGAGRRERVVPVRNRDPGDRTRVPTQITRDGRNMRAGASPVNAAVRETIMERQV